MRYYEEIQENCESIFKTSSPIVDPPGLEPGLLWTKTTRVTNYTKGQFARLSVLSIISIPNGCLPLTLIEL